MENTKLYYVNCNSRYCFLLSHQLKTLKIENRIEDGGIQIILSDINFSLANQIVSSYNLILNIGIIPSLNNKISQVLKNILNKKELVRK